MAGDTSFSTMHDSIKTIALNALEASKPSGVFYGTVVSASPLKIQVEQKMTLGAEFLVLTDAVRDYYVDATVDHKTEAETEHTHAIHDTYSGGGSSDPTSHLHEYKGTKRFLIHNGLKVGEKVVMLRDKGGQRFLVLNRVVG